MAHATLVILPEERLCLWRERCSNMVKWLYGSLTHGVATDNLQDPGTEESQAQSNVNLLQEENIAKNYGSC